MGQTARYRLQYIDRGEPIRNTRAQLQANAETTDAVLSELQDYTRQLASLLGPVAGGATQTVIGIDTDGAPYFDPTSSVINPAGIGLDTDGTPYYVDWTP